MQFSLKDLLAERKRVDWRGGSVVWTVVAVVTVIVVLIALLLPNMRNATGAANRAACQNNLKQIGLALLNYEAKHHELPPAYTTDANGKPLHSWRTLILPFMEEQKLYDSIDLSKPWDDPANAEAFKAIVPAYLCPAADNRGNTTNCMAVITPESCLQATEPRKLSDITDGTSHTMMVVEVDSGHAVPWMRPADADEKMVLGIGPDSNLSHPSGFNAVFADGHAQLLNADLPAAQRRAYISIAGNDNAVLEDDR